MDYFCDAPFIIPHLDTLQAKRESSFMQLKRVAWYFNIYLASQSLHTVQLRELSPRHREHMIFINIFCAAVFPVFRLYLKYYEWGHCEVDYIELIRHFWCLRDAHSFWRSFAVKFEEYRATSSDIGIQN